MQTHKQTNTHTHTHTHSRTLLNEWSAHRRGHYLRDRRIFMPSAGFEPAIPVIKRPQTCAWDCTATGFDRFLPTRVTQSNFDYRLYEVSRLLGCDVVQFVRQTQFFVRTLCLCVQGSIISLNFRFLLFLCTLFLPIFSYPLFSLPSSQSPLSSTSPVSSISCISDPPVKC
jgi:hypothetical protein